MKNPSRIQLRLVAYARKHWWVIATLAGFSLFDIAISLAEPWPTKIVIDSVFGNVRAPGPLAAYTHTIRLLVIVTIVSIILFVIGRISGYIQLRVSAWLNINIDRAVQLELFTHILQLPPDIYSRNQDGEYVFRQNQDTKAVADSIIEVGLTLFEAVVTLGGAVIVLLLLNWRLGLGAMIAVPIILLSIHYFNPIIERQAKVLRDIAGELASFTTESIQKHRLIQIFDKSDAQSAQLETLINKNYRAGLRQRKTNFFFALSNSTASLIQSTGLLFFGGLLILHHELTIGELVIFFSYLGFLNAPLRTIASTINTIKSLKIKLYKVYEVIDDPDAFHTLHPQPRYVPPRPTNQAEAIPVLSFRNVTVMRANRPILKDVSFEIYEKEKIGFIGPSGSGKSTIFDVIMRFLPYQSGQILIKGYPVENYDPTELRKIFGVVAQDSELLSMSIQDNIAFGTLSGHTPTIEEVTAASDAANATEFIVKLPELYNTKIGDKGVALSGGQRQRISIARAMLRNAPILLLDEPTSALDKRATKGVLRALQNLMDNRTTLFVTHDLSLLEDMDRVYVVNDGRVDSLDAHGGLANYEVEVAEPLPRIIS